MDDTWLKVENKLSFGYILSENCFASDSIKLALKRGYFEQTFAIIDINISQGSIELKGRNGSLLLFSNHEYSIKIPENGCSPRFKFRGVIDFDHDVKFGLRPRIQSVAFQTNEEIDVFYNFFKCFHIDPDKFVIDYTIYDDKTPTEFDFVEIELIKSHDFIGSAKLLKDGNVYNDTGGVEWLLRLFYNPPKNKFKWRD